MANISKIKTTAGTVYDIKDSAARSDISTLQGIVESLNSFEYTVCTEASNTPAGVKWGSPEITGTLAAAAATMYKIYLVPSENATGDIYDEYITIKTGTSTFTYTWEKLGDTSVNLDDIGELGYADTASASYTPAGTVSQPTFSGTAATITVKNSSSITKTVSPAGSGEATYTPAGTVSQPTFSGTSKSIVGSFSGTQGSVSVSGTPNGSVSLETGTGTGYTTITPAGSVSVGADKEGGAVVKTVTGSTGSIATFGSAGSLPSLTTSVGTGDDAETLIFTFSQGTLPTAGSATVVTSVSSTAGDLSFSGTAAGIKATFSGSSTTSTGNFTPAGSVALETGTGTGSVDVTPAGTVSQPTFSGTGARLQTTFAAEDITSTGSYTPAGTVSQPTFSGTAATITVHADSE